MQGIRRPARLFPPMYYQGRLPSKPLLGGREGANQGVPDYQVPDYEVSAACVQAEIGSIVCQGSPNEALIGSRGSPNEGASHPVGTYHWYH